MSVNMCLKIKQGNVNRSKNNTHSVKIKPCTNKIIYYTSALCNYYWFYSDVLCEVTPELGEFGVYRLQAGKDFCDFTVEKEPVNIYLREYSPMNKFRIKIKCQGLFCLLLVL